MLEDIADPMPENEALRRIIVQAELAVEALIHPYDTIVGATELVDVSYIDVIDRVALPGVIKTTVTSVGPDAVEIYEDQILIHVIPAGGGTWESPLTGGGVIRLMCAESQHAKVAFATYIKTPTS